MRAQIIDNTRRWVRSREHFSLADHQFITPSPTIPITIYLSFPDFRSYFFIGEDFKVGRIRLDYGISQLHKSTHLASFQSSPHASKPCGSLFGAQCAHMCFFLTERLSILVSVGLDIIIESGGQSECVLWLSYLDRYMHV